MSKKANKFFVDNRFSEIIINKNKNKVKLLANVTLAKFLKKIVMLNIISLAKSREVIVKESGVNNYDNHYLVINNIIDVLILVQLLVKESVLKEQ